MSPKAHLVLHNARVLTLERGQPAVTFVAVEGDRILAAGESGEASTFIGAHTRVVDCRGLALIPGFHDAHCHLLALASSLLSLDCGPAKAASIARMKELVRKEALGTPPDRWIKAFGYNEALLAEGRHPTRLDLDEAAPFHPVRLEHRTGHAVVLNSQAMSVLGISRDTPDPAGGVIARDEATGEPTGLFLEMTSHIGRLMASYRDPEELLRGLARANELLLSRGITSVQDAGPENNLERWRTFQRLKEARSLAPRVTMMVGQRHVADFLAQGLGPGAGDDGLRVGAAKIMLTLTTGSLQPSLGELKQTVVDLHRQGYQVAFHAVEREAVQAAASAIAETRRIGAGGSPRHRIEHCSECPPDVMERVRSSGGVVVTHPGFIYHSGEKYLSRVDAGLQPHLYPLASLSEAGVPWAAGSDAPVTPPDPLVDIYAAVTRRTAAGRILGPNQAVTVEQALAAWTLGSAYSCFREGALGTIKAGKLADLVLLDRDPTQTPAEELKEIKVAMTVLGGQVVWEA